jgi:hypothetical protein
MSDRIWDFGRPARFADLAVGAVYVDGRGVRSVVEAVDLNPAGNRWYDKLTLRDLDVLAGYADQRRAARTWTLGAAAVLCDPEPYDPDEGPSVPLWMVVRVPPAEPDRAALPTAEWFERVVAPTRPPADLPALRRVWLGDRVDAP